MGGGGNGPGVRTTRFSSNMFGGNMGRFDNTFRAILVVAVVDRSVAVVELGQVLGKPP
ncbi:hypothetical protein HanXRQr2_Chr02g0059561 [Helianthus annuus]|uniref:Uncharacterized protein n=1 Tax=Helianthus annuus TaxID=4232 RepID=A0A9K3JNW4_HELAN|nr:hypothetical protein HanXRQr2_Chr02g0059561 [Helianthus annuus]KAJ0618403.1 hypothetical protein HanHA89_Chr02g0052871 [Helianthus annuus]